LRLLVGCYRNDPRRWKRAARSRGDPRMLLVVLDHGIMEQTHQAGANV
jgi:hypothetical protein